MKKVWLSKLILAFCLVLGFAGCRGTPEIPTPEESGTAACAEGLTQTEPAETGTQKSAETGTQKPAETGTQKPAETGTQKAAEPGTQKAAEPGTQKAAEPSTQKPAETSAQKPAEPPTEAPTQPLPDPSLPPRERALKILSGMSVEEKAGQLFIACCPKKDAAKKAAEYHLGGYILHKWDFDGKTGKQVRQTIQSYQDAADIPLLIGVDEEGGKVNRVSLNPKLRAVPFLSPQELWKEGGFKLIRSDTREKCRLLKSLGINLNFAPVCDVSENPEDYIYERTFGKDAAETAKYVSNVVEVMRAEGVGSILKHFPGYGNNADTHAGVAHDGRPYKTFSNSDFLPFRAGIGAGADLVLVSHNIVACMDKDNPASLSPEVHRILREELGFSGVVVTDDLVMKGVKDFVGSGSTAVPAVLAGNDLLCCTDFEKQYAALLQEVQSGGVTEARLDESVLRILMLKIRLGLL